MADLKISALTASTTPLAGTEVLPIVQSSTTKKVSVANLTAGRAVGGLSFGLDAASGALPTTFGGIAHFNANDYTYVVAKSTGNGLILNNGTGSAAVRLLNPAGNGYIEFNTGASGAVTSTLSTAGSFVPPAAQGVNFTANTPAAGMTSQLLNWYEEGTWTPVLADASTGGNTGTADFTFARYTRIGRKVFFNVNFININTTGMTAGNTLFVRGLPFASNNYCNGFSNMASVANVTYAGTMIDAQVVAGSGNIRFYDVKSSTAQTLLTVAALTSGSAYLYINGSYEV